MSGPPAVAARLGAWGRRLDDSLLAPGSAGRLRAVHTAVALVLGLRLAGRDWTAISGRPAVLTEHVALLTWLPAPVPAAALVAVQVAGLLGVLLVVVRRRPRLGFVVAWAALTVLAGLWGSSGKVMHNDVLPITIGAVLLWAAVPGRHTPGAERSVRWGWPPRAALAVLATVYALTGVQKLRHSGLEWVLSDNMAWVLRQGSSPFGAELTRAVAEQEWLTQALAGGALCLELAAPVLLAVRRTRLLFAVGVLAMHASIWAFLGLDYWAWVLTAAAVVVPTVPRRAGGRHPGLAPVAEASPVVGPEARAPSVVGPVARASSVVGPVAPASSVVDPEVPASSVVGPCGLRDP